MKLVYTILVRASLLILLACSYSHAATIDQYRLSVDDQISVIVFQEPDMSVEEVRVSTSGAISMPLIGQVSVDNLTVEEAEKKITNLLLGDYLKKPNVTVTITEYRPFYINGEIEEPGSYPYRKDMTIEKAVALAGGFTERASLNSIKLMREGQTSTTVGVGLSFKVMPGDIITISQSFF